MVVGAGGRGRDDGEMSLDEGREFGVDLEGFESRGGEAGRREGDAQLSVEGLRCLVSHDDGGDGRWEMDGG